MDTSLTIALLTYGMCTVISFFVVLMIKGIFSVLKLTRKN